MLAHGTRVAQSDSSEALRCDNPRVTRQRQFQAGLEPCFATDKRYVCRNYECTWRSDCVKLIAAWLR